MIKSPLMKQLFLFVFTIFFAADSIFAQTPQSVPYQAVARDASGNLLVNTTICVQFRVYNQASGGTLLYEEHQSATTNKLGLFNLNVGTGTRDGGTSSTFGAITWGSTAAYIEIGIDITGGCTGSNTYTTLGRSQMMSVPFALYAGSAASASGAAGGDLTGTYPNPALAAAGTAGTYTKVTTDSKGRVISGTTLSSTDVPTGNLTESTSGVLSITGGTNAVVGSGTAIQVKQASGSQSGYLSAADWTTFNSKQNTVALSTTGSSGAATFNSGTGALNIPNYTLAGLGGQASLTFSSPLSNSSNAIGFASQSTNTVFAGPGTGSAATPAFRALVTADLPSSGVTAGTYNTVTVNTQGQVTSASNTSYQTPLTAGNGITISAGTISDKLWTASGSNIYTSTGNVGIDNTNPLGPLDVNGRAGATSFKVGSSFGDLTNNSPWYGIGLSNLTLTGQASTAVQIGGFYGINFAESGSNRMVINLGNVGIGTTNPGYPLDVESFSYVAAGYANYGALWSGTPGYGYITGNSGANTPVSIHAAYRVTAAEFDATSDRRIKDIVGLSNPAADLATLGKIEVTDFRYKDRVANGDQVKKGFIAQQVETAYPEAVHKSSDFLPDVYAQSAGTTYDAGKHVLTVTLSKAHGLLAGDKVRIISDGEKNDVLVSGINSESEFSVTGWDKPVDQVFVYGRRVNDFRTVDYDRVYTLNVSATQELARQVEALQKENALLKNANNDLNEKVNALSSNTSDIQLLKEQMAALKQLMLKNGIRSEK